MLRNILLNLIGTFLVIFAFLLSTIHAPNLFIILFISIIIIGFILYFAGMILEIKTRKESRMIILKNTLTLNLSALIIFICIMLLPLSTVIFVDINTLKYTGKFGYYTFGFIIWLFFVVSLGMIHRKYFQKRISDTRSTLE